jgi:uncharacterized protein
MEDVKFNLNTNGQGAFVIMDGAELMGEMVVSISDNVLTVYHTEVSEKAEGRGFAKKMLTQMVDYAREHKLKVIPLCPYVHAQFKRHPDEYADIWERH